MVTMIPLRVLVRNATVEEIIQGSGLFGNSWQRWEKSWNGMGT